MAPLPIQGGARYIGDVVDVRWWLTWVVALGACTSGPHELRVDVRTDLVEGGEFNRIVVTFDGEMVREIETDSGTDYIAGTRVYDTIAKHGQHEVQVELFRNGSAVLDRSVTVRLNSDFGITVVLTRDCRGVDCEDGEATQCLAGRCVVPECSPETPEFCGESDCTMASDCPSASGSCGSAVCSAGSCLYDGNSTECGGEAFCDPSAGCRDPSTFWGRPSIAGDASSVVLGYSLSGPTQIGGRSLETIGNSDLFLERRSADGSTVEWTRDLQTAAFEWIDYLRIMPNGQILLAGVIKDGDLFIDDGFTFEGVASHDTFVAVLDPTDGSALAANVAVSDDGSIDIIGVDGDETDRIAAVVLTSSGTMGSVTFPENEQRLPTLVMLDNTATPLWSLPMDDDFEVHAVATRAGVTYVIGCTHGEITIGDQTVPDTGKDALIARIDDTSGSPEVVWLELFDAEDDMGFHDGVIDDAGLLHVIADFNSAATGYGTTLEDPPGSGWQALVMGVGADGTATYTLPFGDTGHDQLTAIEHRDGALLVGGVGVGPFDIGTTSFDNNGRAGFVLELDVAGAPVGVSAIGRKTLDVALTSTTLCGIGEARDNAEPAFYRGREDTLFFDCVAR